LGRGVDGQGLQWVRCEFERAYRVLVTSASVNELCRQWSQSEGIKSAFAETEINAALEFEEQLRKQLEAEEEDAGATGSDEQQQQQEDDKRSTQSDVQADVDER